jgi:hypothetical protein
MLNNVLVTEGQCRNKDLATISWLYCPHKGSANLVLPDKEYRRLTELDPYQEAPNKKFKLGYATITIKSTWQVRFNRVLENISNHTKKGV